MAPRPLQAPSPTSSSFSIPPLPPHPSHPVSANLVQPSFPPASLPSPGIAHQPSPVVMFHQPYPQPTPHHPPQIPHAQPMNAAPPLQFPPLVQEPQRALPVQQAAFVHQNAASGTLNQLPSAAAAASPFARLKPPANYSPMKQGNAVVQASYDSPVKSIPPPLLIDQPFQTSPMAAQYWNRLNSLLTSARSTISILQPSAPALAEKQEKGISGVVATELQGRPLFTVTSVRANASPEWVNAYLAGGIGDFVSYGVHHTSALWVALRLAQVVSGCPMPKNLAEVENEVDDAPDDAVENVRVRVWESEVAMLPMSFVDAVVAARRRMRKIKNRIELCVKILAALEGRGRRMTDASLDKAKLALEKADLAAKAEEERLEASRKAKIEKERKAAERAGKKNGKLQKELEKKRKQRQANAAVSLMMRFVKQNVEPPSSDIGSKTLDNVVTDVDLPDDRCRALPLPADKDVVSASWWLLSEMDGRPVSDLDADVINPSVQSFEDSKQTSMIEKTRRHLQACGKRRKAAECSVHSVLEKYRRSRKTSLDNRTPYYTSKRSKVRGRAEAGAVKLLQFDEDYRPAFFGTCRKRSRVVGPRRPLKKESDLDYTCDSGEEWEDDDGEDILDIEADKEQANEEAELRLLYGSDDEEDDDDFLDDGDAEDDDDEDETDDAEASNNNGIRAGSEQGKLPQPPESLAVESAQKIGPAIVDLTSQGPSAPREGAASSPKRKLMREDQKDLRKRQRRNKKLGQSSVIHGVSIPTSGKPSPLDRYAVTALDDAPTILMFNPYITHVSEFLQETSPPKPTPARISRTTLDDGAKMDLAIVMVHTNSRTSRDNIVYEFCERRRSLGMPIPPKIEVVRAIRIIGTHEKRKGDSRPGWYLRDCALAAKLAKTKPQAVTPLTGAELLSKPQTPSVALENNNKEEVETKGLSASPPNVYDVVSAAESSSRGKLCSDPYLTPGEQTVAN